MLRRQTDLGVEFLQFPHLNIPGLRHGIYTRHGGVSPAPWDSLNLGGTVGDSRANVIENRRRMFATLDLPVETVYDAWQVHGTHAIHAAQPRPLDRAHEKGDIILTGNPDVTLLARFADCVPILLVDPVHRAAAIAHAGWRGTLAGVASKAVEAMAEAFGSVPGSLLAGIGPSICGDCYEVGDEVVAHTREAFGSQADQYLSLRSHRHHLDLWKVNHDLLHASGVPAQNIVLAGICTAENNHDWYSHRAEKGKTGRFGVLLAWEREKGRADG